jgi:hypothetical protein
MASFLRGDTVIFRPPFFDSRTECTVAAKCFYFDERDLERAKRELAIRGGIPLDVENIINEYVGPVDMVRLFMNASMINIQIQIQNSPKNAND